MGDDLSRIWDEHIMAMSREQAKTVTGPATVTVNAPSAGKSWPSGHDVVTDKYIQTVIDYDRRSMTVKVAEEKLQSMLDDMREKIVQQILDEVSVLIDEATRD